MAGQRGGRRMKDQQADDAASWLIDQVKCRAEWARLKGPKWAAMGLRRGRWYEIRSHDPKSRTVRLDAGDKEVEVHINGLDFRADVAVKTTIFHESQWGKRPDEIRYVGNCPKGHEYELGSAPPGQETTKCPECDREFEWEWEFEAVTPSGSDAPAGKASSPNREAD